MELKELIDRQTQLGLLITACLLQQNGNGSNLVFSPLSIHLMLGLIAVGSSRPKLDEILSFLRSNSIDHLNYFASEVASGVLSDAYFDGGPRISSANGVWVLRSLSLKPTFQRIAETAYSATVREFQLSNEGEDAVREVNSWAEEKTHGLVKQALPSGSVNCDTKLILANALYFKAAWDRSQRFDPSETKFHSFHLADGSSVQAPFMTNGQDQWIGAFNGFKVLRLPYEKDEDQNRRFSMYFLLPDTRDGLPALIEHLSRSNSFDFGLRLLAVGDFRIPKFKISSRFEASEIIRELGLISPFDRGCLTEMLDIRFSEKLVVTKMFQASFMEVNEEGTEAAAFCGVMIEMQQCKRPTVDFVADHPFAFYIKEDVTGTVVFMGCVLNPLIDSSDATY